MRTSTALILSLLSGASATANTQQVIDPGNQVDSNLVTIVESHKGNHNTFINLKTDTKSGITTEFDITGK
jgi:hypothetical protein